MNQIEGERGEQTEQEVKQIKRTRLLSHFCIEPRNTTAESFNKCLLKASVPFFPKLAFRIFTYEFPFLTICHFVIHVPGGEFLQRPLTKKPLKEAEVNNSLSSRKAPVVRIHCNRQSSVNKQKNVCIPIEAMMMNVLHEGRRLIKASFEKAPHNSNDDSGLKNKPCLLFAKVASFHRGGGAAGPPESLE